MLASSQRKHENSNLVLQGVESQSDYLLVRLNFNVRGVAFVVLLETYVANRFDVRFMSFRMRRNRFNSVIFRKNFA